MSSWTRDPAERAVAVIGVGAILPDAPDAPSFWRNVMAGRDSITDVTPDRWSAADYWDPDPKAPGKTYSKIGGWVRGITFESTKLKIPPRVAAAMDVGQTWALLCAGEALRDATRPGQSLDTESTAVILGNAMGGERHYETCCAFPFRSTPMPSATPRPGRPCPRPRARRFWPSSTPRSRVVCPIPPRTPCRAS